jgi:alpha-galactosidase/6-phospho-beta-glucosidase family protein
MARPCKLTPELTDVICDKLQKGMSYKLACQAAGINFSSFQLWMSKGEADDAEEMFSTFSNRVHAAEAYCAEQCLIRIQEKAQNGGTFYDTWLLERRYPQDYGSRQHISTDQKVESKNENVNVEPTEEVRSKILGRLFTDTSAN